MVTTVKKGGDGMELDKEGGELLVVVAFTRTRLRKGRSRVELTRGLLWRAGEAVVVVVVVVLRALQKEGRREGLD